MQLFVLQGKLSCCWNVWTESETTEAALRCRHHNTGPSEGQTRQSRSFPQHEINWRFLDLFRLTTISNILEVSLKNQRSFLYGPYFSDKSQEEHRENHACGLWLFKKFGVWRDTSKEGLALANDYPFCSCLEIRDGRRPAGRRWWRRNMASSSERKWPNQFSKDVINRQLIEFENLQQTTVSYCEFTYIISQLVYYKLYWSGAFTHILKYFRNYMLLSGTFTGYLCLRC